MAGALIVFSLIGTSMADINIVGAIIRADVAPGDQFKATTTVSLDKNDNPLDFTANMTGFGQSVNGSPI